MTLLEFETIGEEIPTEIQQETPEEGEQYPEDLPECPDHQPASFIKGKPRSILSLLCFINLNLSPLCLMH